MGYDFSISIWFKFYGTLTSDTTFDALISKGEYYWGSQQEFDWLLRGGSYNGSMFRYRTYYNEPEDLIFTNDLSSLISNGYWHHIVAVVDEGGNPEGKLYLDGILEGSRNEFTQTVNPWEELRIGYYQKSGSLFHGVIDQVRIYKKALSHDEVLYLKNNFQ